MRIISKNTLLLEKVAKHRSEIVCLARFDRLYLKKPIIHFVDDDFFPLSS